jgi:hypothetical protein
MSAGGLAGSDIKNLKKEKRFHKRSFLEQAKVMPISGAKNPIQNPNGC